MSRAIPTVNEYRPLPDDDATCAELRASATGTELYLAGLRRAGYGGLADRTLADVSREFAEANRRAAGPSRALQEAGARAAAYAAAYRLAHGITPAGGAR